MKQKYIIIGYSILVVIAFFAGRATISTETTVEYVKEKEITGSIPAGQLFPVCESMPAVPSLPHRLMVIRDVVVQVVDTAAIIADYELKREYALTAFDDAERGKLELFPIVQYNALQSVDWKFTPVTKVVTRMQRRTLEPFVSVGWSTVGGLSVGGGVFYHGVGVEYGYMPGSGGSMVGVKWRF